MASPLRGTTNAAYPSGRAIDTPVGIVNRSPGPEHHGLGGAQVGAGVARVRVGGRERGDDRDVDGIGHVSRVVQKSDRIGVMDLYRERLWATPWLFISTLLVIPAIMLVFAPINLTVGVRAGDPGVRRVGRLPGHDGARRSA